jgi:hypothetical protein
MPSAEAQNDAPDHSQSGKRSDQPVAPVTGAGAVAADEMHSQVVVRLP